MATVKKFFKKPKAEAVSIPVKAKSPSFPRFIPGEATLKRVVTSKATYIHLLSVFLVVAIAYTSVNLYRTYQLYEKVALKRQEKEKEEGKWEAFVAIHPTYRDGYLKLSSLVKELGDTKKEAWYTEKAREVDPNY